MQSVLLFFNRGYLISTSVLSLAYNLGLFLLLKLIFLSFLGVERTPHPTYTPFMCEQMYQLAC